MFKKEEWKVISKEHITLSVAVTAIEKLNKKDKDRTWRLPSPEELENLPKEASYMNGLNLSDRTFYWTNEPNGTENDIQMVTIPCIKTDQNRRYFYTERKIPWESNEEIYAVATCK